MSNIETLIEGSEKLTGIFGYWPSFHDAHVTDLHLWQGDVDRAAGRYIFPVLTIRFHLWELTKELDPKGYFVLRHHTLANLRFHDMKDFRMDGFEYGNIIFGLSIKQEERSTGRPPFFSVELDPSCGIDVSFKCLRIEVVDALPKPDSSG